MNYDQNLKAFLKSLPLGKMSGHQKFLALAAIQSRGKTDFELTTREVQGQWRKTILEINFNPAFYDRAQREGWVDPHGMGKFKITKKGVEHLSALETPEGDFIAGELKQSGYLIIVNRKGTHSFDKFLRRVFAESKNQVLIADSYVDGTIFDTVLDVIQKTTTLKVLYTHKSGNFDKISARFSREYPKFAVKKYKWLHDRFMIIDGIGYMLGPSIKNAAFYYPALVAVFAPRETRTLQSFFDELWSKAK